MSQNDLDIEEKIASLIGAFSHKREVILEVLKKNNYGIDASALELSEMDVPSVIQEQPPQYRQTNYNNNNNNNIRPQQQSQPQPQQQQQQQQPSQRQQENERDILIKDIQNLIGNNSLDQSTIYAVYQHSNKSIDQTIKTIKELTFDPNEEMKKIEAEIELRKREEELLMESKRLSEQQNAERLQQQRLREEYEKRVQLEYQKKLELEELEKRKQLEQQQMLILKQQEERGRKILEEQRQHQEKLRLAAAKEEELKKKAQEEEAKAHSLYLEELSRMNKQQQLAEEKKRQQQQQEKEKEILMALERKSIEAQLMQQQANQLKQKELENLVLIEKQKREISDNQTQIEILKKKEFESQQQSQMMLEKAKQEIDDLKKRLAEGELKLNQESAKKSVEERLIKENENTLKKQISDLENQKESLRLQILELEGYQKPRVLELEQELKNKQLELQNTISSNQVSLMANLEQQQGDSQQQQDTIVVHWNLENKFEDTVSYWIGVFPTHQPKHDRYLAFKRVEGKEGIVSFPSIIPGHYEARLFKDKYTLIQKSSSVQVGPTVNLTAHVIGDLISVTYKVNSAEGANSKDWIGLYTLDARNKRYTESLYANSADGTVTFKSPRVPGVYQIRYFLYPTKYNEQALISFEIHDHDKVQIVVDPPTSSSESLAPDQEFKVEYVVNTSPPSSSDWVGIFSVNETNNRSYIHSKYACASGAGRLDFRAPLKSGVYEARFFSYAKGKYTVHKVSNSFTVTPL